MTLINWKDEFSVGIREVDDQHKILIDLLNVLFDAMKKGKGRSIVDTILQELADYTVYHFGTEQRLFREYAYPDAEAHREEHDAFAKKVIDFQVAHKKGNHMLTVDVLDYLTDWLKQHILKSDKKFGVYFTSRGLRGQAPGQLALNENITAVKKGRV